MKRISLMLAIVLCIVTIGCNKDISPTQESVPSDIPAPTTENTSESTTEPTEEPIVLSEQEAWQTLSESLLVRDSGYEYICKSIEKKHLDGIECYLMHVRANGQKLFYNSNGEVVPSEFTYGWFAVDKYAGTVYELALDMEHLKEFGGDLPFDPTLSEYYATLCVHSDIYAYSWVKAILDKDPAVCTDLAFDFPEGEKRHEEWYDWLYRIKIGSYSVKIDNGDDPDDFYDDELVFVFDVVESEYDVFPEGEYSYVVQSGGLFYIWWYPVGEKDFDLDEDIDRAVWRLSVYVWDLDPADVSAWENNGIFWVAYDMKGADGKISVEDLADAAYAVFGIEGFDSGGGFAVKQDGVYTIMGRGGDNKMSNIVDVRKDGNIIEVYVRMYGDLMKTVKSYYVKYVFERTDGEYPYRVLSVKTLDEGVKTPFGWST